MRILWLLVGLCLGSEGVYAEQTIGFRSEALLSSPAMEIDQLESSWASPDNGDYAQGRARLDVYVQLTPQLEVGVEQRWDYLLEFSPETAQFYSRLENNTIEAGEYDLSLTVNAAQSRGLFAQYFIPLSSNAWFKLKGHVLQGQRIQKGQLSGTGVVTQNSFAYDWQLDYAYDENRIFDGQRSHPNAWGYSFDVQGFAQIDHHSLFISLEDLMYTLHWDQVDQDNGCLDRPLTAQCTAVTTRGHYTQHFPVFTRLAWGYQFNDIQTSVEAQAWQRYRALWMGAHYQGAGIEIDAINEMLNLGYESSRLKVKWGFDTLNASRAKHWQLTLGMNWPIL